MEDKLVKIVLTPLKEMDGQDQLYYTTYPKVETNCEENPNSKIQSKAIIFSIPHSLYTIISHLSLFVFISPSIYTSKYLELDLILEDKIVELEEYFTRVVVSLMCNR